MTEIPKRVYDLEDRSRTFAMKVRDYVNKLPRNISNIEYGKQLIISRKEAKESEYWLSLAEPKESYILDRQSLIQEAIELRKIFGAIVEKCKD